MLFIDIDCSVEDNAEFCTGKLKVKSYPTIRHFPFGEKKRSVRLTEEDDIKDIEMELEEDLEDTTQKVNEQNMNLVISNYVGENISMMMMFHNGNKAPLAFTTIAKHSAFSEAERNMHFVSFPNPSPETQEQFQLKLDTLPKLFIIANQSPEKARDEITSEDIAVDHFPVPITYKDLFNFFKYV